MSQLTTHILDTTQGKPAEGVRVLLFKFYSNEWSEVTIGTTDSDGRISDLLNEDAVLEPGIYKLRFETKEYFEKLALASFYPYIEIVFTINGSEHYHVPLLLNPFGYSTYRGS